MKTLSTPSKSHRRFTGCVVALVAAGLVAIQAQGTRVSERWVGTWATAVVSSQQRFELPASLRRTPPPQPSGTARPAPQPPIQSFNNQTVRQIVHTSIGGSRLRVVFSNAFGPAPLAIGAAGVALRGLDASIAVGSSRPLLFAGKAATMIPAGAVVFSDPVNLTFAPFADLAIDAYLPGDTAGMPLTMHSGALQTNYVSEAGDHTGKTDFPTARTVASWYFVGRVEVVAPEPVSAVVTLGDSITDGTASTANANHRWPDDLAKRLASGSGAHMAVLNLGIGGNRLLSDGMGVSALTRFDRDVAAQTGVTDVIVLEGINDIGFAGDNSSPSASDIIAAHQQLIARAHALGLKIFGGTLTPFDGAAYATAVGEAKRMDINKWIRTSGAYDGVVDFEAAVRDPKQPSKEILSFDPGDHLHLTDSGYQAMADAVDLRFFRMPARASSR